MSLKDFIKLRSLIFCNLLNKPLSQIISFLSPDSTYRVGKLANDRLLYDQITGQIHSFHFWSSFLGLCYLFGSISNTVWWGSYWSCGGAKVLKKIICLAKKCQNQKKWLLMIQEMITLSPSNSKKLFTLFTSISSHWAISTIALVAILSILVLADYGINAKQIRWNFNRTRMLAIACFGHLIWFNISITYCVGITGRFLSPIPILFFGNSDFTIIVAINFSCLTITC